MTDTFEGIKWKEYLHTVTQSEYDAPQIKIPFEEKEVKLKPKRTRNKNKFR